MPGHGQAQGASAHAHASVYAYAYAGLGPHAARRVRNATRTHAVGGRLGGEAMPCLATLALHGRQAGIRLG